MNKLVSILVGSALGLTLATSVGVGVAVGSNAEYSATKAAGSYYQKITSNSDLKNGNYLIVYESSKYVFNGSLSTLDASNNYKSVTISNNRIESSATIDTYIFHYDANEKTLKSYSGLYIGATSDENSLASSDTTKYVNNISVSSSGADIVSENGPYLRYNSSKNQKRFRYYRTTSYTSQQVVQLYKYHSDAQYTVTYNANGATSGTAPASSTHTYGSDVTPANNTGNLAKTNYIFGGWNTVADGSGITYAPGDEFTIEGNTTLYAYWIPGNYEFSGDEIVFKNQNLANATEYSGTFTNNSSFTVNFTGGYQKSAYYNLGLGMRIYRQNGTININALNNKTITSVVFTWAEGYGPTEGYYSLSSGSFADQAYSVWTGSASSLALANTYSEAGSPVWRLQAIAVEFSDTSISNPVLSGTPTCSNHSSAWDVALVKVTALLNNVSGDYTDRFNIVVNTALPTVTENTTMQVSVTATLKTNSSVTVTSNLTANLIYSDDTTIERLYYSEQGELDGYFYGIFMGYSTRTQKNYTYYDYYLANGDYGIYIYGAYSGKTGKVNPPSYTPFQTYLKVEGGYLSVYNNLYEVSSYVNNTTYAITTTEITNPTEKAKVGIIKTYVVTGDEIGHTTEKSVQVTASRLALVEGRVKSLDGTIASYNSVTVVITLDNGNDVPVFIKNNIETLDYTKLANALVVGNNVSVKGFTSIYNTEYQVVNPIDVEVEPEYTADEFAQYLLDNTDAICQAATDTNGPLLAPVWIDLEINKWPTLSSTEKSKLSGATANESGTVVQQAMARYDLICGRYGLTNFIGRSINYPSHGMNLVMDNNQIVLFTAILGLLSTTAFAAFYMLRKRKQA